MQIHSEHVPGAAEGFLPHGFCYLWNKPLLYTHFWSDLLIGLSYVCISFSLAYLVHRARRDIPFSLAFIAFGLFIITCGMTHFMEIWTLWEPVYWLSGGVKVVTAVASVSTAVAMPFLVPRAHATIRDAKLAREREIAAARAAALEEQNALLEEQARELDRQRSAAETLARELAEKNEALENAVRDAHEARTIAEEATQHAQAANRAKGEFLAVMSHELRTPLNAIGGYAQLLEMGLRGPLTHEQREDIRRISRSQRHLLGLINDILDYSRLESSKAPIAVAELELSDVLADALLMIEPQALERGLTCVLERCDTRGRALADRAKLRQIVLNLLSNAVKYTPAGGRITLGCGTDALGAYLIVSDNGVGIPREKHEEIFEPFVQLDRSLTRQFEGTGLGLAISRRLARQMGADVSVDSEPGKGSTFTVRLATPALRIAS